MTLGRVGLAVFVLAAAVPCRAQTQDNGSATPSAPVVATKPTQSASAPPTNSGSATTAAVDAAAEKKKPKKVWTNEDLKSVPGQVSVIGDPKATVNRDYEYDRENPDGDDARQVQIENYRDQIQQLRGQIDAIDQRIAQLRNFKGENTSPSGGISINHGYNMVPVEDQVKQLEEKKKKLESKIEDVEVEARKNAIDPGELR